MPVACARPSISMPRQRALPSCHCSGSMSTAAGVSQRTSRASRSELVLTGEEARTAQDRESVAQRDDPSDELDQRGAVLRYVPVDPAERIVLSVGIVIALLAAAEFVAGQDHRRALRQQQRRKQIALLPVAQLPRISGSSVGPSAPPFQDRLSEWPS